MTPAERRKRRKERIKNRSKLTPEQLSKSLINNNIDKFIHESKQESEVNETNEEEHTEKTAPEEAYEEHKSRLVYL